MLRYYILMATIFLSQCSMPVREYIVVNQNEYINLSKCWTNGNYNIALMVIDKTRSKGIPHLISPFCNVIINGYSNRDAILAASSLIPLAQDNGKLKSLGYLDVDLDSNTYDHISFPKSYEQLYFVRFHLIPRSNDGFKFYEIGRVFEFCKTGFTLGEYQDSDDKKRRRIGDRGCSSEK
jgi:hypothetical protein